MPVTLSARPSPVCWTNNPITFTFVYTLVTTEQKLHLQVLDYNTSYVFAEVMYPYADTFGVFNLELSALLDPLVQHGFPASFNSITQAGSNQRLIRLRWRNYNVATNFYGSWKYDTESHTLIKGGVGDMNAWQEYQVNNQSSNFYAPNFLPAGQNFLTWLPSGRLVGPDERGWLLYFSELPNTDQLMQANVYYLDGSTQIFTWNLPGFGITDFTYKTFHLPVGIQQLGLDPAQKGIQHYRISVRRGGTVLAETTLRVDNRPFYDTLTVHYINSMGGTDTIRFRGEIEHKATAEKKEYEQKHTNQNPFGKNPYYDSTIRLSWKANTGYLSDTHSAALLDLLQSKHLAMVISNTWVPLRIKNKETVWRNTRDKKNNQTVEFETAGSFGSLPRQIMQL